MGNNDKQWSSATPGLLIFLVDQSGSMLSSYEGSTRTKFSADAINKAIADIIEKNMSGIAPKNRCFISIIGYNHNVSEIASGWLSDLAANPKRIDKVKKKMLDGAGGILEGEFEMSVWVDPITNDGATNMKGAFELAKSLCEQWINDNPNNPAPVIVNITDGVPYYEGKDIYECMEETVAVAKDIMSLSNNDGNVLIFNAEIGADSSTQFNTPSFPSSKENITSDSAKFLYDITSVVPSGFVGAAEKMVLM